MSTRPFSQDIRHHKYFDVITGFDKTTKLTSNFYLHEFYEATFMLSHEWVGKTTFPLHKDIPHVAQLVRDYLGKAITVTSAHRTYEHELSKGRKGTSQHVNALAVDLKGVGLPQLIREAIETKNELYRNLRSFGVNAIGIYDTFVHFDLRAPKSNGELYFWDNSKKNGNKDFLLDDHEGIGSNKGFSLTPLLMILPFLFLGRFKFLKF